MSCSKWHPHRIITDKAFAEFGTLPYAKAINHARKVFTEWQDPDGSRRELKVEDILRAKMLATSP